MALGLPDNINLRRLAFLFNGVSGRKGLFFQEAEVTSADQGNNRATRVMQRKVSTRSMHCLLQRLIFYIQTVGVFY
jgi:hypothetical protein